MTSGVCTKAPKYNTAANRPCPCIFPPHDCIQHHMTNALKHHWPEYLMEAACLGLFMVSAFTFGTLLEHPASPLQQAISNSLLRRFLMGLAMGGTAIAIIYSP